VFLQWGTSLIKLASHFLRLSILGLAGGLLAGSASSQNQDLRKGATDATRAANQQFLDALPFDDTSDFDDADATITLSRESLNSIVLQQATLADAVAAGDVEIDGDQAKLNELVSYLDTFGFWFDIVTP